MGSEELGFNFNEKLFFFSSSEQEQFPRKNAFIEAEQT